MKSGAILIYDNLVDTITGDSQITDSQNLLTPQLSPVARVSGATRLDVRLTNSDFVNAVALWGVEFPFDQGYGFDVERWNGSVGTYIPASIIVSQSTAFSRMNLIAIFDQPVQLNRLRINISAGSALMNIGHLQVGKAIQDESIADAGFSIQPVDVAIKDRSSGGQQFSQGTRVVRRVTVNQGTVPAELLYGRPKIGESMPFGNPVVAGDFIAEGEFWRLDEDDTGGLTWPGLLVSGEHYIVEVESRVSGSYSLSEAFRFETNLDSSEILAGRVFVHATAISADLEFFGASGSLSLPAGAVVFIRLLSITKTPTQPLGLSDPPLANLTKFLAESGTSKPVGLVLQPSSPLKATDTSIFGIIESIRPYTDIPGSGDYTAGGFTLLESL